MVPGGLVDQPAVFDARKINARAADVTATQRGYAYSKSLQPWVDKRDLLQRFREANVARCTTAYHPIGDWNPLEWGAAAAGELGELLNMLKKMRLGKPIQKIDIAREIADTITYLDLLAFVFDINIEQALVEKFNLVSDRVGSDVKL